MAFTHPETNLREITISNGMKVADIGAGSGSYVSAISKMVGERGKVYAIDVQKELLSKLKTEALRNHLDNVDIIWADAEKIGGTKLSDSSVDVVLLSNIVFQVSNKRALVKEAFRILKPEGVALIIDWRDSFGGLGPQKKDVVLKEEMVSLVISEGLSFKKEFDTGDHHYGLVFIKK